jgi:hypothetical protein
MTYIKNFLHSLFPPNTPQDSLDTYSKVLSWALFNFHLQSFLHHSGRDIPENIDHELEKVGYTGTCMKELSEDEFQNLFTKEAFFSSSQTGKRIISFALQENGLNQEGFEEIEKSITKAYDDVKNVESQNELLKQTYQHCIETLCVFKL